MGCPGRLAPHLVKSILRKYPPDLQDAAVELVLQQALGVAWAV